MERITAPRLLSLVLMCCLPGLLHAQPARDADYRLFPRDLIRVSVFGEPDMNVDRRIDGDGSVSLPLIGPVQVRDLTTAQAEAKIRSLYLSREIFVHPQVTVAIVDYAAKEVSVMGQVKNPGAVAFPMEADSLPVVDVISRVGGFTRIGRADNVRVTRRAPDGTTETFTLNVKSMLEGRSRAFLVMPGDVVFVPETIF